MKALGIALLVQLAAASDAWALSCDRSARAAPDGGMVPRDPVLHLFVPAKTEFEVRDESGRVIAVEATHLSSTNLYGEAYRLSVKSGGARELRVRGQGFLERVFTITETAPAHAVATHASITRVSIVAHPTYPRFRVFRLHLTPAAPAYRVEWAPSSDDLAAGNGKSIVLPARVENGDGTFVLGSMPCGSTFDWEWVPVWVKVVALHADGRETPADAPILMDPAELAPPRRQVDPPRNEHGVRRVSLSPEMTVPDGIDRIYVGYKHSFRSERIRLREVLDEFERWSKLEIILADPDIEDIELDLEIAEMRWDQALWLFAYELELEFQRYGREVYIHRERCPEILRR